MWLFGASDRTHCRRHGGVSWDCSKITCVKKTNGSSCVAIPTRLVLLNHILYFSILFKLWVRTLNALKTLFRNVYTRQQQVCRNRSSIQSQINQPSLSFPSLAAAVPLLQAITGSLSLPCVPVSPPGHACNRPFAAIVRSQAKLLPITSAIFDLS